VGLCASFCTWAAMTGALGVARRGLGLARRLAR
jgi:hypothetical protein